MKLYDIVTEDKLLELKMSNQQLARSSHYSKANAMIGFEFECFVKSNKFTDYDEEDLYNDLDIYRNVESSVGGPLQGVTGDTSIAAPDGYTGVEIVTDPISYNKVPELLKHYFNWIKNNARTNDSCGLHINISIKGKNKEDLDLFKMALFMGEKYVLTLFNRLGNKYALPHMNQMSYKKNISGKDFDNFVEQMNLAMDRDKYHTFNISKSGYIEFRVSGGEGYENTFDTTMDAINRFVYLMELGANKDMARQEYMKKVANFISRSKSSTQLDSDYGIDLDDNAAALGKRVMGSPLSEDTFTWFLYVVFSMGYTLTTQAKLTVRKFAKSIDYDEDVLLDDITQKTSYFSEDKNYKPFIQWVKKLLSLR